MLASRGNAIDRTLAGSLGVLILMVAAMMFPFLEMSRSGFQGEATVIDAALVFSGGIGLPLALAVAAFIIAIPMIRAAALCYTLLPLRFDKQPAKHAAAALRLAMVLKPWSMAEIFLIGVAVALVKIGGMATVTIGPAFWCFVGLVILGVFEDAIMCKWTLWRELERRRTA